MRTVALGEVVDFHSGGTPSKAKAEFWAGDIPWFSAKDMKHARLSDSEVHISDVAFSDTSLRKLPAGTVAMVVRGMILAHTVPISILDVEAAINQDLKALLPRRLVDPSFLAAMLRAQHSTILAQVSTAAHGTKKLESRVLEEIRIPLPPLAEQRRIAAILDHADALRAKCRRVVTHLDALAQSIFREMFPPGSSARVPLGDLTSDTLIGLVRSAAEVGLDRSTPYMKMDAITRTGGLNRAAFTATDASPEERIRFEARDGDLMFNTRNSRDLVGKTAIFRGEPAVFNNNLMRIRFGEKADAVYVHSYLWSHDGRRQLEARKSGTTSVFAIYAKNLVTVSVPLPPVPRQHLFAERVGRVAAQRAAVLRGLAAKDELFASLQARAFRGEL